MIVLYILAGIVLLFLLILMLRINVILINDGELSIFLKLLFVKIRLFPNKKTPKLSDFKIKKFRKWRLKEEKKLRAKQKKKDKKAEEKNEKENKEEEHQGLKVRVDSGIDLVRYVIAKAVAKFGKHLRIEIRRIAITVSGDDPATVAVTYGCVCQAVSYIMELADNSLNTKYPKGKQGSVSVGVDYISGKSNAYIDITLGIRVWQVLSVLLTALKGYVIDMADKKNAKKTADKKESSDDIQNKNEKRNPVKAGTEV